MPTFGTGEWAGAVAWIRTTISPAELWARRAAFIHRRDEQEARISRLESRGIVTLAHSSRPYYDQAVAMTDIALARLGTGPPSAKAPG